MSRTRVPGEPVTPALIEVISYKERYPSLILPREEVPAFMRARQAEGYTCLRWDNGRLNILITLMAGKTKFVRFGKKITRQAADETLRPHETAIYAEPYDENNLIHAVLYADWAASQGETMPV